MRRSMALMTVSLALLVSPVRVRAHTLVVSDPAQLHLLDVEDWYQNLTEQLKRRFDVLGAVRRAAGKKMAKGWGLAEMPDKSPLYFGTVSAIHADQIEFVLVLKGEKLDTDLLRSRILEKYRNHWKRHNLEPKTSEATLAGGTATVLPYMERGGEIVLLTVPGGFLLGSVVPGHYALIERTAEAAGDPDRLETEPPESVKFSHTGKVTDQERTRIKEFFTRTITPKVQKFRKGFEKLYKNLQSEEFDPEEFKTTNEKINDLFLKLTDFTVDLEYTRGSGEGGDLNRVQYTLRLPTPEDAQAMKELLLEKMVFYKENARSQATIFTMDSIALDVADSSVVAEAELEGDTALYNFSLFYLEFLLSYTQADRYLVKD